MITLIGVSGVARSGKDTATEYINDYLKDLTIPSYRYGLADPIKEQVAEIFGWGYEEMYGDFKEDLMDTEISVELMHDVILEFLEHHSSIYDAYMLTQTMVDILYEHGLVIDSDDVDDILVVRASPRTMFQLWGTEFGRRKIKDSLWFDLADEERARNPGSVMVISDVRFENEGNWIKNDPNGLLIAVDRPNNKDSIGSAHASEQDLGVIKEMAEALVTNDGTLEELEQTVRTVCKAMITLDS